jgi:hypothetical protein
MLGRTWNYCDAVAISHGYMREHKVEGILGDLTYLEGQCTEKLKR